MSASRRVAEGVQRQGEDESIRYGITTTAWGSSPSSVIVVAKDITDPNNISVVTDNVLSGSASVSGDVITCPALANLTKGHKYKIEVRFTDSNNNVWEPYIEVWADE